MAAPEQIGAGKTILIIEDDPSVQTLIKKALVMYGFAVNCADDGLEGLMKLEAGRPDLIIADMMMPRLDGMSFVKAIKGRGETRTIPVIFLTAKSDPKSMIEGINLGARFYVTKPFQIEDLIGKVQKALKVT